MRVQFGSNRITGSGSTWREGVKKIHIFVLSNLQLGSAPSGNGLDSFHNQHVIRRVLDLKRAFGVYTSQNYAYKSNLIAKTSVLISRILNFQPNLVARMTYER